MKYLDAHRKLYGPRKPLKQETVDLLDEITRQIEQERAGRRARPRKRKPSTQL